MYEMPRKAKNDNPLKLYEIASKYSGVPAYEQDRRALVNMMYDYVKTPGGRSETDFADDRHIYHVAKSLVDKAHNTYSGLTKTERLILDSLLNISKTNDLGNKESRIERLCIQIEYVADSEISDRVEKVAQQVLGHGLRVSKSDGYCGF